MTRAERIEKAARALLTPEPRGEDYEMVCLRDLRAALAVPEEPAARDEPCGWRRCPTCGGEVLLDGKAPTRLSAPAPSSGTPDAPRPDSMAVACPTCGATPGTPCTSLGAEGRPLPASLFGPCVHIRRQSAAWNQARGGSGLAPGAREGGGA